MDVVVNLTSPALLQQSSRALEFDRMRRACRILPSPGREGPDTNGDPSLFIGRYFMQILATFLHVVAVARTDPVCAVHFLAKCTWRSPEFDRLWRILRGRRNVGYVSLHVVQQPHQHESNWRDLPECRLP